MTLLIISFVAGLLTVLAPCILPLLPVIVGGSLGATGGKVSMRRALVVTLSLGASVIVFTLLLKASTLLIDIPESFWKWLSGGIILAFGVITLFPRLWEGVSAAGVLNRKSNALLSSNFMKQSVWGDIVVGAALGPVFSTCSPTYFIVLASVLPVNPIIGMGYLLAYTLGLCLSLLVIAFVGQKLMAHLGVAANPDGLFKRTLGVVFIVVGLAVLTGYDKKLEAFLVSDIVYDITKVEQYLLESTLDEDSVTDEVEITLDKQGELDGEVPTIDGSIDTPVSLTKDMIDEAMIVSKKTVLPLAKEISTPDGFVNTGELPITINEFKGKKVVLLDIWTYSCINCQRTLPYLNSWHEKYSDEGLVIIGLHTPEFAFERKIENVEEAAKRFAIKYPIVLDNDYSTWNDYGNHFWPRKYLIDIDGRIVYDHIGEGDYDGTEGEIQRALKERSMRLKEMASISTETSIPSGVVEVDSSKPRSPEIYFGAWRNESLANGAQKKIGTQMLVAPAVPVSNNLYLGGPWNIQQEYAESSGESKIIFKYSGKNVYMVMSAASGVTAEVYRDGVILGTDRGADVDAQGLMKVDAERLYHLIGDDEYDEHVLEIRIPSAGLQAFTFTFG